MFSTTNIWCWFKWHHLSKLRDCLKTAFCRWWKPECGAVGINKRSNVCSNCNPWPQSVNIQTLTETVADLFQCIPAGSADMALGDLAHEFMSLSTCTMCACWWFASVWNQRNRLCFMRVFLWEYKTGIEKKKLLQTLFDDVGVESASRRRQVAHELRQRFKPRDFFQNHEV